MIIAGFVGANLFAVGLAGYALFHSRHQHELRAQVHTQNVAQALDQSLSGSIERIDLALRAITDEFERQIGHGGIDARQVDALLARYEERLPEVEAIRVAEASGRVIFGKGLDPVQRVSWADRDYFITLRDHADAGLQISKPRTGRVAKKMIVGFARRINRPDGSFAGVVSAPVALDYFSTLMSSFNLGSDGSVILRDADLGLMVRYPALAGGPAGTVGSSVVSKELRELALSGAPAGTYHTPISADLKERIVSFRRIERAPMFAIAAIASEDYLADWSTEVYRNVAGVASFALISLLATWGALHLLNRVLRESARNRLYLHHASDGIHILDAHGDLVEASDEFCAMLGYERTEAIGLNVSRWDARWAAGALLGDTLPRLLATDTPEAFETCHRRKDGALIDVEVNAVGIELDGRRFLYAASRDIGEKKRAQRALRDSEARLRQSEERYRQLLANSPVGILHYDRNLVVTYANERFDEIMRVPKGHMLGLDCSSLQDQSVVPGMREALAGKPGRYEGPYVTTYGQVALWIAISYAPVVGDEGKILGGMLVLEDITRRKEIEVSERRQRESLAHLNEIAAMSHLPLDEQLHLALSTGARHLGLEFGIVSRVAGDTCRIVAQASPPDTLHDGQVFPFGTTYCQITLEQDGVLAIAHMGHSPYLGHPCYQAFKLEAYIGAAVVVAGEVFGTVNFSSPQPSHRPFDDGDREFVGLLARWVGSAIDRDQAQKRLTESEARLQAIIENEPECVKVLGPGAHLVQMNRAGLDMLEVASLDEAVAFGLLNFVVAEHRKPFIELSERVFKGETGALEFMVDGKRGTRRWLETHAAPLRDADGKVAALLGVTRDITARKRADSELRLAASVFGHAHEGIVICDAAQVILDVNPTFSEITGYTREEAIGRNPKFLGSGRQDAEFYRAMWQAIDAEGHWEGEVWNRRRDGASYAERLTISAVRDEGGRITHYIGTFSDVSLHKKQQAQLERLAHFDSLTQLPNRALLSDRMSQALAQSSRTGTLVAVCYLDLDGFKAINDEFGHEGGDLLLVEVARRLKDILRSGDTVARLGGDEFVMLLTGIASVEECDLAATRFLRALTAPFHVREQERCISGSLGITIYPQDGSDPDTLLRHADQSMYLAKQAGKNRYQLFDAAQDQRARQRRASYERLALALANGEFRLHYQPIVDMRHGKVLAFEGLVRWARPEQGLLRPAEFLPAIANTELDVAVGRWVLAEGLRQLAAWRAQGLTQTLSLNVSAGHLLAPNFVEELAALLAARPELEPGALEIEVLETAAIDDMDAVVAVFRRCREAGIRVALDDFGTGYSSLSYFRRLPVDTLKIDQMFVQSVLGNAEDLAVVDSVISLTRAFDRNLVAEGVETIEIGMLLLHLGCNVGQGYAIAHPMPGDEIPGWLAGFVPDRNWAFPATHFTREDMPLFLVELDHRTWVRQIGAWLAADAKTQSPPPLDSHACRFGQWYSGPGMEAYGRFPAFQAMRTTHEAAHDLGKEFARLRTEGRRDLALARFGELNALRDRLVAQVGALQAEIAVERM